MAMNTRSRGIGDIDNSGLISLTDLDLLTSMISTDTEALSTYTLKHYGLASTADADLDKDGVVSSVDAMGLYVREYGASSTANADLDGDGIISIKDATKLQNWIDNGTAHELNYARANYLMKRGTAEGILSAVKRLYCNPKNYPVFSTNGAISTYSQAISFNPYCSTNTANVIDLIKYYHNVDFKIEGINTDVDESSTINFSTVLGNYINNDSAGTISSASYSLTNPLSHISSFTATSNIKNGCYENIPTPYKLHFEFSTKYCPPSFTYRTVDGEDVTLQPNGINTILSTSVYLKRGAVQINNSEIPKPTLAINNDTGECRISLLNTPLVKDLYIEGVTTEGWMDGAPYRGIVTADSWNSVIIDSEKTGIYYSTGLENFLIDSTKTEIKNAVSQGKTILGITGALTPEALVREASTAENKNSYTKVGTINEKGYISTVSITAKKQDIAGYATATVKDATINSSLTNITLTNPNPNISYNLPQITFSVPSITNNNIKPISAKGWIDTDSLVINSSTTSISTSINLTEKDPALNSHNIIQSTSILGVQGDLTPETLVRLAAEDALKNSNKLSQIYTRVGEGKYSTGTKLYTPTVTITQQTQDIAGYATATVQSGTKPSFTIDDNWNNSQECDTNIVSFLPVSGKENKFYLAITNYPINFKASGATSGWFNAGDLSYNTNTISLNNYYLSSSDINNMLKDTGLKVVSTAAIITYPS